MSLDDEDADIEGTPHERARQWADRLASSEQAAEWFVRLRDDRLSTRHRERNVRWLKESPTHIAELLRVQQVYKAVREAKVSNRLTTAACDQPASNVIELKPRIPPPAHFAQPRTRSGSRKIAAAVACLAVFVLLGFAVKVVWFDRTLETELGEWRTEQLIDGTHVRIGPDSVLRVAFGDDHRTVRLIRGEAMFTVAKDPSRPFFVHSEMIGVLAIGTEFRVSHWGGEDVVAVTEGNVAVYRDGRDAVRGTVPVAPDRAAESTGGVALVAGERVSVTRTTQSAPVTKQRINVDYELAWAHGWLVYEDKTIAEVANEFNRRNRIKIVVSGPTLAARRLAFFRGCATDPESFAHALATGSDIVVVRDRSDELRIELSQRREKVSHAAAGQMLPTAMPGPIWRRSGPESVMAHAQRLHQQIYAAKTSP